jgi:hypothetical protein
LIHHSRLYASGAEPILGAGAELSGIECRGLWSQRDGHERVVSQRTFTLERLEQVLRVLEVDFFELARLARGTADAPQQMTEAQQHAPAFGRIRVGNAALAHRPGDGAEGAAAPPGRVNAAA